MSVLWTLTPCLAAQRCGQSGGESIEDVVAKQLCHSKGLTHLLPGGAELISMGEVGTWLEGEVSSALCMLLQEFTFYRLISIYLFCVYVCVHT